MDTEYNYSENELLYIQTFTDKERKAFEIARSHLGMSFDLQKSIGFQEWKKKQDEKPNEL
tara:strand:- start:1682 stop:1861 length:180 start_codon:yes stop_codon:yes gene_type:complete